MSVKVMSLVFESPPHDESGGLRPAEKLILLSLADHGNDRGRHVYPKVATIARRTGLHDRTVQRVLKRLRLSDLLSVVAYGGGRRATEYKINVDLLEALVNGSAELTRYKDAEKEERIRISITAWGDTGPPQGCHDATPGVTQGHPRGDTTPPESLYNHDDKTPENHSGFFLGHPGGEVKNPRALEALRRFERRQAENPDRFQRDEWPEELWPWIDKFLEHWPVSVPDRPRSRKGGVYGDWITSLKDVRKVCGEFGLELVDEFSRNYYQSNSPFPVARPGAIVNSLSALAGVKRKQSQDGENDPDEIAAAVEKARRGDHVDT